MKKRNQRKAGPRDKLTSRLALGGGRIENVYHLLTDCYWIIDELEGIVELETTAVTTLIFTTPRSLGLDTTFAIDAMMLKELAGKKLLLPVDQLMLSTFPR